jgi:hypothetical protein
MTTKRPQRRSFRATVAALIGDRRGNALALTAAAIVPWNAPPLPIPGNRHHG